ncbi:hypothetical protein SmJEL517_g04202 [Synchytrium microbalum]|uniref:Uncharacterized protein n=1 Tax=Synchytrium microbalum TaxID=1806994 RepID=A0A507C007_9FUNG|nr:uncharacterized protein SmJEL517_g04202 [Synchytrium microbalum]TPX32698.1 hypothetical protein SmJEL517_g04202 [Synchytrium microbalum]
MLTGLRTPYSSSKRSTSFLHHRNSSFSTNATGDELLDGDFQDLVDQLDAEEFTAVGAALQSDWRNIDSRTALNQSTSNKSNLVFGQDELDLLDDAEGPNPNIDKNNDPNDGASDVERAIQNIQNMAIDNNTSRVLDHEQDLNGEDDDDTHLGNFSRLEGLTDLELTEYGTVGKHPNDHDSIASDQEIDDAGRIDANHDNAATNSYLPTSHPNPFEWAQYQDDEYDSPLQQQDEQDQQNHGDSPVMSEDSPGGLVGGMNGIDDINGTNGINGINDHQPINHDYEDVHPLLQTQLYGKLVNTPTPAPYMLARRALAHQHQPIISAAGATQTESADIYSSTPRSDYAPTTASSSFAHDTPGQFDQMVEEMRNECRSLKALNERLLNANEELRTSQTKSTLEHEASSQQTRKEFEGMLQALQRSEEDRRSLLQKRIEQLQQDLHHSKASASQLASIRATMEREKELDILEVKKEVMSQKERQLQEIRREMQRDKEEMQQRLREDIEHEKDERAAERRRLESDLARTKRLVEQKEEEIRSMEQRLIEREHAVMRRPVSLEVATQVDSQPDITSNDLAFLNRELDTLFGADNAASIRSSTGFNDTLVTNRTRRLIDRCRAYVESTEQAILQTRGDLAHALNKDRRDQTEAARELTAKLEERHRKSIQDVTNAHNAEAESIKARYEALVAELRKKADDARFQLHSLTSNQQAAASSSPKPTTIDELETAFPSLISRLKSSLTKQHESETDALLASAENRRLRDVAEAKQLASEEAERTTTKIRERCAKAYETAVTRLKEEYVKVEAQLRDKVGGDFKQERDACRHEGREEGRRQAREEARRDVEGDVTRLRQKIIELENMTSELNQAHQRAVSEIQARLEAEHREALNQTRQQYVSTLRTMRDDVAASKQRGVDRLEDEWRKRKERMEQDWQARLDDLKKQYEQELRPRGARSSSPSRISSSNRQASRSTNIVAPATTSSSSRPRNLDHDDLRLNGNDVKYRSESHHYSSTPSSQHDKNFKSGLDFDDRFKDIGLGYGSSSSSGNAAHIRHSRSTGSRTTTSRKT